MGAQPQVGKDSSEERQAVMQLHDTASSKLTFLTEKKKERERNNLEVAMGEGSKGSSVRRGHSLVSVNTEMAGTLRGGAGSVGSANHSRAGVR